MDYETSNALIAERVKGLAAEMHPWFERGMIEGSAHFEMGLPCRPFPKSHMDLDQSRAFSRGYVTGYELYERAYADEINNQETQEV